MKVRFNKSLPAPNFSTFKKTHSDLLLQFDEKRREEKAKAIYEEAKKEHGGKTEKWETPSESTPNISEQLPKE